MESVVSAQVVDVKTYNEAIPEDTSLATSLKVSRTHKSGDYFQVV